MADGTVRHLNPTFEEDERPAASSDGGAITKPPTDALFEAEGSAAVDDTDEGIDPTDESSEHRNEGDKDKKTISSNVSSTMGLQESLRQFQQIWSSLNGTGTGEGQLYVFTSYFAMLSLITLMDFKWPFFWLYSLSWIKFFAFPFKFIFPVQFFVESVEVGQVASFYVSLLSYPALLGAAIVRRSFFDSDNKTSNDSDNKTSFKAPEWLSGTKDGWKEAVWAEPKAQDENFKFKYKRGGDDDNDDDSDDRDKWVDASGKEIPQLSKDRKILSGTLIRSDDNRFQESTYTNNGEDTPWQECLNDITMFEQPRAKSIFSTRMLIIILLWVGPPAAVTLVNSALCWCIYFSNFAVVWFMGGAVACPGYVVYRYIFVQKFTSEVKERELPEADFFNAWAALEGQLFLFCAITMHLNMSISIIEMLTFDPQQADDSQGASETLGANQTAAQTVSADVATTSSSHDTAISVAKGIAWIAILPYTMLPLWACYKIAKVKQAEERKGKQDVTKEDPPWFYAEADEIPGFRRDTTGFWSLIGTDAYRNGYKSFQGGAAYEAYWKAQEDDSDSGEDGTLQKVGAVGVKIVSTVLNPGETDKHDDEKLFSSVKDLQTSPAAHREAKQSAEVLQGDPHKAVAPVWTSIKKWDGMQIDKESLEEEKKLLQDYYLQGLNAVDRKREWHLANDGHVRARAIKNLIDENVKAGGAAAFDAAAFSLISAFTDYPIRKSQRRKHLIDLEGAGREQEEDDSILDKTMKTMDNVVPGVSTWGEQGWWFMKSGMMAEKSLLAALVLLASGGTLTFCSVTFVGLTTLLYVQQTPMLEKGEDFSECFGRMSNFITVLTGALITHAGVPEIAADIVLLIITGVTAVTFARALGPNRFVAAVQDELRRRTALRQSKFTNVKNLQKSMDDVGTKAYQRSMRGLKQQGDNKITSRMFDEAHNDAQVQALRAVQERLQNLTKKETKIEDDPQVKQFDNDLKKKQQEIDRAKEAAQAEKKKDKDDRSQETINENVNAESEAKKEKKKLERTRAAKMKDLEEEVKHAGSMLSSIAIVLDDQNSKLKLQDSDCKKELAKLKKYATTDDKDGWTFNVYNDPLHKWDPMRFKMLSPSQKLHLMRCHPNEVANIGRYWDGSIEIFGKLVGLASGSKGVAYGSPDSEFEALNLVGTGSDMSTAAAYKRFKEDSSEAGAWSKLDFKPEWPMRFCGLTDETQEGRFSTLDLAAPDVDMIFHELTHHPILSLTELNFSGSKPTQTVRRDDGMGKKTIMKTTVIAMKLKDLVAVCVQLPSLTTLRLDNCSLEDPFLVKPHVEYKMLDDHDLREDDLYFSPDWFKKVGTHLKCMNLMKNKVTSKKLRDKLTANAMEAKELVSLCGITSTNPTDVDKRIMELETQSRQNAEKDSEWPKHEELFKFDHENNPRMDLTHKQRRIDLNVNCHWNGHDEGDDESDDEEGKTMIVDYESLKDDTACEAEEARRIRLSLISVPSSSKSRSERNAPTHPKEVEKYLAGTDLRTLANHNASCVQKEGNGGLAWKPRGETTMLIHNAKKDRRNRPPALNDECMKAEERRKTLFQRQEDEAYWDRRDLVRQLAKLEAELRRKVGDHTACSESLEDARRDRKAQSTGQLVFENPANSGTRSDEDDNPIQTRGDEKRRQLEQTLVSQRESLDERIRELTQKRDTAREQLMNVPYWHWALLGDRDTRHTVLGDEYRREVLKLARDCRIENLEEAERIRQRLFVSMGRAESEQASDLQKPIYDSTIDYITEEAQNKTDSDVQAARELRGSMGLDYDLPYDEFEWYSQAWSERRSAMAIDDMATNEECDRQERIRKKLGLPSGDGRAPEDVPKLLADEMAGGELADQHKGGEWASRHELTKAEDTGSREVDQDDDDVSDRVKQWLRANDMQRYNGGFRGGKLDSGEKNAIVTYTNQDAYDGQLVAGKRDGKGTMEFANGNRYEGYWQEDRMDNVHQKKKTRGDCKYTWCTRSGRDDPYVGDDDPQEYSGGFKMGLASGKVGLASGKGGKMVFQNGDEYKGEWDGGSRHGVGTYTPAGDTGKYTYTGKWEKDAKTEGTYDNKNVRYKHGKLTKKGQSGWKPVDEHTHEFIGEEEM